MRYAVAALLLLAPMSPAFAEDKKDEKKKDDKTKTYEVEVVKDVAYIEKDADKERHVYDMYLPKGAKDYPVLFFIHGGGWRNGSKAGFAKHGKMFASHGIAFVATNYRLSPKVHHPDHIKDVAASFAHVRKDLKKRGADVSRIYVCGHSAGGHLCALLATDESYLEAYELSLKDIKGCIPISGVFSVGGSAEIWGSDKDLVKKASPMVHIDKNLPSFLCFYADKELGALGKQAEAFGNAMKKAEVKIEVKMIKDRDHGTIMRKVADADDEVTKAILAFITK